MTKRTLGQKVTRQKDRKHKITRLLDEKNYKIIQ